MDLDAAIASIRRDGYVLLPGLLDAAVLTEVRRILDPLLDGPLGRNPFEGHLTRRVYTLVRHGRVFEELTEHPAVLAVCDAFLHPGYLLSASQAIRILPGEAAQPFHTDDPFYTIPRPRPPCSVAVIWSIDPFTDDNGATDVVPRSQEWGEEWFTASPVALRAPAPERLGELERQALPAVMPEGSALLVLGTTIHRGGANRSRAPRLALTNQYCEPWARTQENFFLGVPREHAAAMSPRLQELLGYSIWGPFMGHVGGLHPRRRLEP